MLPSQPLAAKTTNPSERTTRLSAILTRITTVRPILPSERSSPLTVCAIFVLSACYMMFSITIFLLSLLIDEVRRESITVDPTSTVQEGIVTLEKSTDCSELDSSCSDLVELERATNKTDSAVDLSEEGATKGHTASVDTETHTEGEIHTEGSGLCVITANLVIQPDTPIPPDSAISLSPNEFETEALQSATDQSSAILVFPSGPPPPPPPPPPQLPRFKRLRCLNWTPIPCVTGSVFDIREGKVVLCESVKESVRRDYTPDESISKSKSSLVSGSPPGLRMSILTNDRSRNIEIVLRRTSIESVIDALMAMDTKALPLSVCSQLTAALYPQPYEIEGAQRKANLTQEQIEMLPRSDRYIVKLLRVPNYAQRMSDMVFLTHVIETLHETQNVQRQVAHCTQYLLNNSDLQLVFDTILAIGNVLNENTPLEKAQGFRLDILPLLKHKRTVDGRNFNHTLCEVMKNQYGGFGAALLENKSLCCLKKVSDTQIAELNRQLTAISTRGPGYGTDRFKETVRTSKELLDHIMQAQKYIHASQKRLCKFFIADEPDEIYSTVGSYLSELASLV